MMPLIIVLLITLAACIFFVVLSIKTMEPLLLWGVTFSLMTCSAVIEIMCWFRG